MSAACCAAPADYIRNPAAYLAINCKIIERTMQTDNTMITAL